MTAKTNKRVEWVDLARGVCIILVVMMHSTLGVEAAFGQTGWLHAVVDYVKPFRIPAFFLVSGLLVSRAIDSDWRSFLDRKVLHFVYFYVLWITIQFALKGPGIAAEQGAWFALREYLFAFVEPFGTLWFIYLLPIFFVVVKATRAIHPLIVWTVAAALEIAHIGTQSTIINEFAARFVYFYTGYILMQPVFAFADHAISRALLTAAAVAVWAVVNGYLISAGLADAPGISLCLGLTGSAVVIALSALFDGSRSAEPFRYCGRNSLAIYLAFFLFMASARVFFLRSGLISDIGTVSLLVTIAAVIGPLVLFWLVRGTKLRFLFERPAFFRLQEPLRAAPQR